MLVRIEELHFGEGDLDEIFEMKIFDASPSI